MTQAKLLIMCLWMKSLLLSVTARKPFLKKLLIFLGWLHNKEVSLALCQNVENGCAREVLMPVSFRSSFWHQQVVTNSWCEIKCQLVFGAHRIIHAMAKGNVRHYIGQTKRWTIPLFESALKSITFIGWYSGSRLRSSLCSRNSSRVNSSSFSWIEEKQTLILTSPGIPSVTQRKDVKLSAGGVAIPGSLLVHWRITTGFEGLPLQNLDLISSTFSTSKSFVAGGAVANTCCWNSTEPILTPIGGSELKFDEEEATPSTAVSSCSSTATSVVLGGVFFWIFNSLLNVNRFSTRKSFFGWDFTSLSKRSKGFQFKLKRLVTWERRALIRERSSFWGLWNKRFQNCALVDKICTFLNCTRGCSGLLFQKRESCRRLGSTGCGWSKMVLFLCRVRSKLRVVVVPQNSHSKIPFWRPET